MSLNEIAYVVLYRYSIFLLTMISASSAGVDVWTLLGIERH